MVEKRAGICLSLTRDEVVFLCNDTPWPVHAQSMDRIAEFVRRGKLIVLSFPRKLARSNAVGKREQDGNPMPARTLSTLKEVGRCVKNVNRARPHNGLEFKTIKT